MTEKNQKSLYISYLFYLALVTSIVSWPGCAQKPTVIHLTRPLDPDYQLKSGVLVPTVGQFHSDHPENTSYARYIRDYLDRRLTAKRQQKHDSVPPANSATDAQPLQINAMVKLLRVPDPTDPDNVAIHTEVVFTQYDPKSDSNRQSIILRGKTSEDEQAAIQAVLRKTVDFFMNQMFPQKITIACPMARGKSRYDRLGRRAADHADFEQAFQYFRKAVDEYPDDHAALYNAGLVSEALLNYPRALKYYQRALKLSDDVPQYYISLHRVRDILGAPF